MHLKHPIDADQQMPPPFSKEKSERRERLPLGLSLLIIVVLSCVAWATVVTLIRLVL